MIGAAVGALGIGGLVYVFDRHPETVYFLSNSLSFQSAGFNLFGVLGHHLPSFVHVYAFILLTALVTSPYRLKPVYPCLAWFSIDSLFELGQYDPVAQWIASLLAGGYSGLPFFENSAQYFLLGTFDVIDLVAIGAGTVAAYPTIRMVGGEYENEQFE